MKSINNAESIEKFYKFTIPKTIDEIVPIVFKNGNEYNKNEAKILLSIIWLNIIDTFPEYDIEQAIEELFKSFSVCQSTKSMIVEIDKNLSNSKNEELKQMYLKYPIHDNIHDENWSEKNIYRYTFSLRELKVYLEKTTPNNICTFLIAKNTLDKMIDNITVRELLAFSVLKDRKGLLYRILHMKKIKETANSLKVVKERWVFYSNILYSYITEDEKYRYEVLLGERLRRA